MPARKIPASILFILLFLLTLHTAIPALVPIHEIYHYRLSYPLIINNPTDFEVALDKIKREIHDKKMKDYVIILGDSVFYGSPGRSDDTFNAFIEKEGLDGHDRAIYNLSLPASQTGDIYAALLKLDEYGISADHLIFNVRYASFVPRLGYESALFWWMDDLRTMDREAYYRALPSEVNKPFRPFARLKSQFEHSLLPYFNLIAYKDYLNETVNKVWLRATGGEVPSDELGPSEPWYTKATDGYLEQPEIQKAFSDVPMDLSENNVDVFFMNKIIAHQKGKQTLLVLTGTNHSLMKSFIEKPGYEENERQLHNYLSALPVQFLNLEGRIPDNLFTDHTHLMPAGYRELGRLVWDAFMTEERQNL